ncbi:hypothetical protein OHS81_04235 [Streptomyces sp. NBC_00400]|uniref:hypothetical protein n=1 Tax=Streptomyces sp. NBC_00400 TaxID=2975737 RepID=UPI002E236841
MLNARKENIDTRTVFFARTPQQQTPMTDGVLPDCEPSIWFIDLDHARNLSGEEQGQGAGQGNAGPGKAHLARGQVNGVGAVSLREIVAEVVSTA